MRALSDGYLTEPKFEVPGYEVIDTLTARKTARAMNRQIGIRSKVQD
jgi:hypothetical protein